MKKICIPFAARTLQFSIPGLITYLILVVFLCSLGNWQLHRSEEKKAYLQQLKKFGQVTNRIALNQYENNTLKSLEYKKVTVDGYFDASHQFLIDNQIKNGQVGYFVMTPFFIKNRNQAVLVNRGWLAMNKDRSIKPEIDINMTETILTGRVNHFPVVGIKLEGADIPTETWPAVVQVVNTEILSARLGYLLLDFQIELDADSAQGYQRDWQDRNIMSPEKHFAYAMQWFALALALTVLFIWISFKKNE